MSGKEQRAKRPALSSSHSFPFLSPHIPSLSAHSATLLSPLDLGCECKVREGPGRTRCQKVANGAGAAEAGGTLLKPSYSPSKQFPNAVFARARTKSAAHAAPDTYSPCHWLGSADMIFKAINSWIFPQFSDETICNPRVRRDYWRINNLSLACHFNTLTQFPVPWPSNVLETWKIFWKQQVPTIGLCEYAALQSL